MKKRYQIAAALAAFCGTSAACTAMRDEGSEKSSEYLQMMEDIEPLIRRGLRAHQRALDASLSSADRSGARTQLDQAVCPDFSARLLALRQEHEARNNSIIDPFEPPRRWQPLVEWCADVQG